jgi:hypothetical protein
MTKLCPRGKAAAKRKFKVYPSAYANAYASKICAGKIKDPSGVKRKDFKGPKPTSAKEGMMTEIEKEAQKRKDIKKTRDMLMKAREEGGRTSKLDKDIATNQAKQLLKFGKETGVSGLSRDKRLRGINASDVQKLMDAMPKYNVGGHSVMGSPVSVGDVLSNPSASAYYKDLLK